jgi:hypothetical protein
MYHRTHLWHVETLDGRFTLLDENQSACQYGNELTCAGVQHETSDEYHGKCGIDKSDRYIRPAALLRSQLTTTDLGYYLVKSPNKHKSLDIKSAPSKLSGALLI